jgi:Fe2+ or Zn2+ uptake regulation protein
MGTCQHPDHHHPEHGPRPVGDVEEIVRGKIARVRSLGMRRTQLLENVLRDLAGRERPVTIGQIEESIGKVCDTATLYRMVERLVEAGVLRRIGLHERARYYELVLPGRHHDYLICTECGAIGDIDLACPVDAIERELAGRTGYSGLQHDLVFFGRCPECQGG